MRILNVTLSLTLEVPDEAAADDITALLLNTAHMTVIANGERHGARVVGHTTETIDEVE
jgi:hypothetical protein